MAPPPTSSDGLLIIEWQGANQAYRGATTLGVQAAAVTETSIGELAGVVENFVDKFWDTSTTDIDVSLKIGPSNIGPTFPVATGLVGGRIGAPAAPNVSLLLSKEILNISGRKHGRMYLPAPLETEVADRGLVPGGALSNYQGWAEEFYDGLVATDWAPQVYYANSSDPRLVSSFTIEPTVATQRRRMRR